MGKYSIELSKGADRDLKKLPLSVQRDIVFEHLPKIQVDPFGTGIPLVGVLKGERAYHFGRRPEYRIIYFVDQNVITVTIIGSREGIYRKAKRRKKK